MRRAGRLVLAAIVLVAALPQMVEAKITRIEITKTESPTFDGTSFGSVGPYEKLVGRAYGEVDPDDPRNTDIVDLALAARNVRGLVEYATDIMILRPVDPAKGNRRLFFDINNRGDVRAFGVFNDANRGGNNPTAAADAGIGFLMRQGYTVVWSGWDATAVAGRGRFTLSVPTLRAPDGGPLVGASLEEIVIDNATTTVAALTYPAAHTDTKRARLTTRVRYEDSPTRVPDSSWEFASPTSIRLLPEGTRFEAGRLYELVYSATDPVVTGLGFAAIRDVASFLHHRAADDRGTPNPLAGAVQHVFTFCYSQPCRAMHDFVRLGFNEDESGRRVVDGVLNLVGGGSGIFMNYRFGQPGVTHRQHIGRWFPEYEFPFANQVTFDPVTGRTDGRFKRCLETNTCPRVFEVNSANEYWAKAMSAAQLDGTGKDLVDLSNERWYFLSSVPHAAASGPGFCQLPRNPLQPNAVMRALLTALDAWVTQGVEPPASKMPRRADNTLAAPASQASVGFPRIPGVIYNGRAHTGDWLYFGPTAGEGIVTLWPPVQRGTPYPLFVPTTDADGNDVAGIRIPEVAVPLATYTGWALRATPPGANDGCDASGQMIAFRARRADREAAGDPRLSIEERYADESDYVRKVTAAAEALTRQRFLLAEDVERQAAAAAVQYRQAVGR